VFNITTAGKQEALDFRSTLKKHKHKTLQLLPKAHKSLLARERDFTESKRQGKAEARERAKQPFAPLDERWHTLPCEPPRSRSSVKEMTADLGQRLQERYNEDTLQAFLQSLGEGEGEGKGKGKLGTSNSSAALLGGGGGGWVSTQAGAAVPARNIRTAPQADLRTSKPSRFGESFMQRFATVRDFTHSGTFGAVPGEEQRLWSCCLSTDLHSQGCSQRLVTNQSRWNTAGIEGLEK
jgi:hypothetical protein